jgi:multiple sugar transport system substrate-binding protein
MRHRPERLKGFNYRSRAAAVVAVLALVGAACGADGPGDAGPEADPQAATDSGDFADLEGAYEGETLRIIMIQDPWVDAFAEVNPAFEELTGATVEIDAFGYDDTYANEVLAGSQGSTEHDVIVLDSPWIGQFQESGFVDDLTDRIQQDADIVQFDDFVEVFQEVAEWNGEITGIPFGAYFIMTHYRTDLFEEAGIDPPSTIEEWKSAAEFFTDNPDYPDMYGTALNNQRGAAIGQAWFEYIWNFGGRPFESTIPGSDDPYENMTPMFDSPESIEVVETFVEMLEYQPPGAESFAWDERATTFSVGQTAMVNAWSVRTPGFTDPDQSRVGDDFATTLFPHKEGVDPIPPVGGWLMGINSASDEDRKDFAWDYIKWFTSPDIHKQFVLAGGPPSRVSTLQDPDVLEVQPWAETLFESQELSYAEVRPRIPEAFEIIDTVGFHVSRAVQGQASVEDAMTEANEEVAELLRNAGYHVDD